MFNETEKRHLLDHGYCVVTSVLSQRKAREVRIRLLAAAVESERRGETTYKPYIDPNSSNVRVFNLLDLDPIFTTLIQHPLAFQIAAYLLDDDFIVSNFTANIAKPGSGSMEIHSDLALVMPEPWALPGSLNVVWCLDDVTGENGGTLFMPGSHRFTRRSDVPSDIANQMIPFEAKAGSIVVMDGRLWHTSGANTTRDQERALLFGYYSRPSVPSQWDFDRGLSQETKSRLDSDLCARLGLARTANCL